MNARDGLITVRLAKYRNRNQGKFRRLVWEIVWAILFRPTPRWCMNRWRCFLLRLFGAKVGRGVRIQGSSRVWQPWKLTIGADSWIDGNVSLYSVDTIDIGANAVVSDGAFVCTASHDISSNVFDLITKPIAIGDSAWISARAIILPGVNVGEGAVVAAGAVVTKDVEPWHVVGGNPAKTIRCRDLTNV